MCMSYVRLIRSEVLDEAGLMGSPQLTGYDGTAPRCDLLMRQLIQLLGSILRNSMHHLIKRP